MCFPILILKQGRNLAALAFSQCDQDHLKHNKTEGSFLYL